MLACRGWEAMGTFGADTIDLADLEWSPTDSNIAVWDSPLEYKVCKSHHVENSLQITMSAACFN
jgi:hypothetical protein